jgi:hypothetical protein
MTTIASFDEPRPRGTCMGERVGGAPLDEAENDFRCDKCGGWFDARDLAWVDDHEGVCDVRAVYRQSNVFAVQKVQSTLRFVPQDRRYRLPRCAVSPPRWRRPARPGAFEG